MTFMFNKRTVGIGDSDYLARRRRLRDFRNTAFFILVVIVVGTALTTAPGDVLFDWLSVIG